MDDIITIDSLEQITDKMSEDGDLRDGDYFNTESFECLPDDDLGFYQQACAFLVSNVLIRLKNLEKAQDKLEKIEAMTHVCEKDHMYIAKSKEYPCPLCIINRILKDKR